jgi:glycosyltransferase involved in cell wall biosynthesis
MLNRNKISLLIPCKNEEAALYSMLQKVPQYVDEVIVIDNGSSDNTGAVAKRFGARVLREDRNVDGVGYGFAHQTGMAAATGDIIIAMDGDNTYPIESIEEIITYMENSHSDFVSCARFPLADSKAISGTRQLGVRILNLQVSLLYGYQIKDILSGMWAMKRECVDKLDVKNGEWNFSPEIKLAALTHPEIHFSEYHINHAVRLNGLSKQNIWKTGFNHLLYIVIRRFTVDHQVIKQQIRFVGNGMRELFKNFFSAISLKINS